MTSIFLRKSSKKMVMTTTTSLSSSSSSSSSSSKIIFFNKIIKREFGLREVSAWIKRQEKVKLEQQLSTKEAELRMEEEKQDPLYLANIWKGNDLFDDQWPIKIPPHLSLMYEQQLPSLPLQSPSSSLQSSSSSLQSSSSSLPSSPSPSSLQLQLQQQQQYDNGTLQQALQSIDEGNEQDIEQWPYSIVSLLVVERLPIIKKLEKHEEEYQKVLREIKLQQKMPELFRQLYIDKIKKWDRERQQQMKLRPRITAEDRAQEYHSLNRCLDRRLYLIVKSKSLSYWEFPQHIRNYDETLIETAERALSDKVGPYLKYLTISEAPFGHMEMEYSKEQQKKTNQKGMQIFYHKAYYISGNGRPDIHKEIEDLAWVPKNELADRLDPKVWDSIHELILD